MLRQCFFCATQINMRKIPPQKTGYRKQKHFFPTMLRQCFFVQHTAQWGKSNACQAKQSPLPLLTLLPQLHPFPFLYFSIMKKEFVRTIHNFLREMNVRLLQRSLFHILILTKHPLPHKQSFLLDCLAKSSHFTKNHICCQLFSTVL